MIAKATILAAALVGSGLLGSVVSASAADGQPTLQAGLEDRAAALSDEREHPIAAERFERLWNKSLRLVDCGAGFGRGTSHLMRDDVAQQADEDTHRLIEWAQMQGLGNWSALSAAGTWISTLENKGANKPAALSWAACASVANELHAGVLALRRSRNPELVVPGG
jgi:hypothetical protein